MATLADLWDSAPSSGVNVQGLNADLADRVGQAAIAYRERYGKELPITSGVRTPEQQAALQASGNKYPVAAPGKSKHQYGNAVDIGGNVPDSFLKEFGLHRPMGSKDPVHIEADPKFAPKEKFAPKATATLADLWEATPATTGVEPKAGDKGFFEAVKPTDVAAGGVLGAARKIFGPAAAAIGDIAVQAPGAIAGQAAYASSRASGRTPEEATQFAQQVQQKISPRPQAIGEISGTTQEPGYQAIQGAAKYIGENIDKGIDWLSQKLGMPKEDVANIAGSLSLAAPEITALSKAKVAEVKPTLKAWKEELGAAPGMEAQFKAAKGEAPFASVGAAGATPEATVQNYINMLPPQLAEQLRNVPAREINVDALKRHVEASSLPVEVPLTRGQATQHGAYISEEMNLRGKNPEYAARFNQQNQALVDNLQAIRDIAAPDVYATRPIESGEALIKAYKDIDSARTKNINELYTKLRDAAGGDFPIDAQAFVKNADSLLKKDLKTEFVPASIEKQLEAFRKGEPMSFEQFEAMRTNLAAEMRKAQRSGDGNAERAASVIRQALEDLPLSGGAKDLKPLADAARSAAKERFDALKADSAMNAAVNDAVKADDFVNKFVVRGKKSDIETMVKNLGEGSQAHQTMSSGVVNWLTNKAGITEGRGNFTQAGYNKALATLDEKLGLLVNPEAAQHLRTLGNVSHYTQYQPKGSYVNNSNTLTAAIASKAANAAETALNVVGGGKVGLPIGSMIRGAAQRAKQGKEIERTLRPAAGTKLKDIGKM